MATAMTLTTTATMTTMRTKEEILLQRCLLQVDQQRALLEGLEKVEEVLGYPAERRVKTMIVRTIPMLKQWMLR